MGATVKSWEVSDDFWSRAEKLLPERGRDSEKQYARKPGGGRKPLSMRLVFEAIVYVLRTGCQWKAISKEKYGAPSSIHKYFKEWAEAGFFTKLWGAGLAEYNEMEGIAWEWQSIDGSMVKAPLAKEKVGPNPTDRGKKWEQATHACGRAWRPAIDRRNRCKSA